MLTMQHKIVKYVSALTSLQIEGIQAASYILILRVLQDRPVTAEG